MNKHALFHQSDSLYAFPLTANSVEIRLRTAKNDVVGVELIYGLKHWFYKDRKTLPLCKTASDGLYDYYTTKMELSDVRLAYVFRLTDTDGKQWYYSEDGATADYDFSLAYFSFFQFAYINANDVPKRVDWLSNAVVYQIFVDRFYRERKPDFANIEWGQKPTPKSIAGGDLDGISAKLNYLTDLGVNTLYLTPIFTSSSNHKYDISDYYNVDPHFGGNAAFERLMNNCKKRGMRVVLDAVFNHCSENLSEFKDVVERGAASPYYKWFVIHGDKPTKRPLNYEVFAECDYMPKLNTASPEVAEYLCGVGEYWINKYDIDGWRLDVSDEVSHAFWRKFRDRIKAIGADKVLIGENWHDARPYLDGTEFDSVMNYAFTKAALDFFVYKKLPAQGFADKLNALYMRNTTQANYMMFNLLDCHDTDRFYSLCGKNENTLLSAVAVNVFMPGAAMIYYGTEIPLEGGYDPDNRRCFDWAPHAFTDKLRAVLKYKKLRALGEGSVKFDAKDGALIIERTTNGQTATLTVNNTDSPVTVGNDVIGADSYKIIVS